MEGEAIGAADLVLRVVARGPEAGDAVGADPDPAEGRVLIVAGRRERDQLTIARAEAVAQEAEVLLRLVAPEFVDQRQRPAPAIEGVGV